MAIDLCPKSSRITLSEFVGLIQTWQHCMPNKFAIKVLVFNNEQLDMILTIFKEAWAHLYHIVSREPFFSVSFKVEDITKSTQADWEVTRVFYLVVKGKDTRGAEFEFSASLQAEENNKVDNSPYTSCSFMWKEDFNSERFSEMIRSASTLSNMSQD